MTESSQFQDSRVWFVTGTSQGFGLSLITYLLSHSQRVIATARNPSNPSLTALQSHYPLSQLVLTRLDVTKLKDIERTFGLIEERFGRLDVVVNNAGWAIEGELEFLPEEIARVNMETLFWGPFNITKKAVRFFRELNPPGQGGRIFQISSIVGYHNCPGLGFYGASKFALEGMTEALLKELHPEWNIKGTILELGGFPTNCLANSIKLPLINPPYSEETSPSRNFLKNLAEAPFTADLEKAAKLMLDLVNDSYDCNGDVGNFNWPLRLPLGSVAWEMVTARAKETVKELQEWKKVAVSVDIG